MKALGVAILLIWAFALGAGLYNLITHVVADRVVAALKR